MCTSTSCPPAYYEYSHAMSTETDGINDDTRGLQNETDSDFTGLSHLDAPNESLYMIGGVCVAMFMVGVIIVLLAVTISKLRKREEHSNTVHPAHHDVILQTTTTTATTTITGGATPQHQQNSVNIALNTALGLGNNVQPSAPPALQPDGSLTYRGQFLWQYPPPPPMPFLYNKEQDTLVQTLPTERPGFVRGFRKNLGGRWRRLVKRKPPTEVYTIPAELKPQLKQIYVY